MPDNSPIDREWLRDRLLQEVIDGRLEDADAVHKNVGFCLGILAVNGICYRLEFEAFLGSEPVQAELRDAYATVLRRKALIDPVGLCQWGAPLFNAHGRGAFGRSARALRELLAGYPEAVSALAREHAVTPSGMSVVLARVVPVVEVKPKRSRLGGKAHLRLASKAKTRKR